eukprot:COSAG01_NODE_23175_length_825_cov_1.619835_2_plen_46_part_01
MTATPLRACSARTVAPFGPTTRATCRRPTSTASSASYTGCRMAPTA